MPAPISSTRLLELFAGGLVKGMTVVFLLLLVVGIAGWWRTWKRRDHQVAVCTSLVVLLAVWVHLWWAQTTCQRYFFPLVIMLSPFAGLGLLKLTDAIRQMADRWAPRYAITTMPAALLVALNLTLVFGSDWSFRAATTELGCWARKQFGSSPRLYGPDGVTQVVNYYAGGAVRIVSARGGRSEHRGASYRVAAGHRVCCL